MNSGKSWIDRTKLNIVNKQFFITKFTDEYNGWTQSKFRDWTINTKGLPVIQVMDLNNVSIGICIGYPIKIDDPLNNSLILNININKNVEQIKINECLQDLGGKFIILITINNKDILVTDAFASLGVVYSTLEQIIALTPTLISGEWDKKLIDEFNMPSSGLWYPFGITAKANIKRLLPNHYLDLSNWEVKRYWPNSETDIRIEQGSDNTKRVIDDISLFLSAVLENALKKYSLDIFLTAGRDSRMILACCKNLLSNEIFFHTIQSKKYSCDIQIATLIAQKFKINHSRIPVELANLQEMDNWQVLVGRSVSGDIWKIHKTLTHLSPSRVAVPGMGGEVGRAFYYRSQDFGSSHISLNELLMRASIPQSKIVLDLGEKWMAELSCNIFNILDLFYWEQRVGCWAGPQSYGNVTSAFEFSPYNNRKILNLMLKLPFDYRMEQKLCKDICQKSWPELLDFPFNEYVDATKVINIFREVRNRFVSYK